MLIKSILRRNWSEAFQMARKPEDCVSIGGHNTLVFQKRLMIFGPRPRNGGSDSLICGMNNLPHFGVAAPYEVDIARHPCIKAYSRACWMHFRRKARYKNVIREFREDEVIPLPQNPGLVNRFRTDILPLLQEAKVRTWIYPWIKSITQHLVSERISPEQASAGETLPHTWGTTYSAHGKNWRREGFEPTVGFPTAVFKTAALNLLCHLSMQKAWA